MFYRQIGLYEEDTKSVYVYKIPTRLTDEQILEYLKLKQHRTFNWYEVNNVKVDKNMNKIQFMKMFPSEEQIVMIKKIHNYFKNYESRQQNYVQMKTIACRILYNKGLMHEHIKDVMSYKNHSSIVHLTHHRTDLTDYNYELQNFWHIVENGLYPVWDSNGVNRKVKWVKLNEINKY